MRTTNSPTETKSTKSKQRNDNDGPLLNIRNYWNLVTLDTNWPGTSWLVGANWQWGELTLNQFKYRPTQYGRSVEDFSVDCN